MIKIAIIEVYIPARLCVKTEDLYVKIVFGQDQEYLLNQESGEIKIEGEDEQIYELYLLSGLEVIGHVFEDFRFLSVDFPNQVQDDWVVFQDSLIKVRFAGSKIGFSPISSISSQETQDFIPQSPLLEFYSPCPHLNILSNIECRCKSLYWKLNFLQLNGIIPPEPDFTSLTPITSFEIYGNSQIDLDKQISTLETRNLSLILLSLIAKEKWAKIEKKEIALLEKVSDCILSHIENLQNANKLINKSHRKELESIDSFLDELDFEQEKIAAVVEATISKNLKLEAENQELRRSYEESLKENIELDEENDEDYVRSLACELTESLKNTEKGKKDIENLKEEYEDYLKKCESKMEEVNQDVEKKNRKKIVIEKEIEELKRENKMIGQRKLYEARREEFNRNWEGYEENDGFADAAAEHVKKAENYRLEVNRDSVLLLNRLEKSSKVSRQKQQNLKKNIESIKKKLLSRQSQSATCKIQAKLLKPLNCTSFSSLFSPLSSITADQLIYLSDSFFSLCKTHKNLQNFHKTLQKLFEINNMHYEFTEYLACTMNPQYFSNVDYIDDSLSHYINMHKAEIPYKFIRKGFGLYNYANKSIQLLINNGKIVVKAGAGFLPISEFIKSLPRRSASLNKTRILKENMEFRHKII